jgi:hypothetical protein
MQKVHVENCFLENPQKIDKNFDVSFSSTFCLFHCVFRCYLAMGVQKHHKKRFTKQPCRGLFTKKSTKNPKPISPRFFANALSEALLGEGSSKARLKNLTKNLTGPGTFLASEEPTNHPEVRQPSNFVWV